ncbi:MAG: transporter substrate-binding domain-containing protein [Chloroflexota bacterium]
MLRVNLDLADGPWGFVGPAGGPSGFDAAVAKAIARRLGVATSVTSWPAEAIRDGAWEDRFDIALARIPVTPDQAARLVLSQPYAWDPQQLAATVASGVVDPDGLAGAAICTEAGMPAAGWLDGTLLPDPLGPLPAIPPIGAAAWPVAADGECTTAIADGSAPFTGWLASWPTVDAAIAGGLPAVAVGVPVLWLPVAVGFDPAVGDGATLRAAIDAVLAELAADGTLARLSARAFRGADLTVLPIDGVPVVVASPLPSASAAP